VAESNVKLRVDARDAVNALQQTNRASEKLNNTLGRTEKRAATATGNIQRMGVSFRTTAASIVAITGAVTFFSRSLNVLGERQADAAALANGLQKLGKGEAELKRLQKAADELGKATLFNQEDFDAGFALLTSFTSIGVNSFERVAEAAADVAQITGQDVSSSLLQLAKALQDPVRGLTALSRSGTTFTDQQKEQIKALVESGRQLEAQDLILREIETQYGNAARAAGSAGYAGAVDSLGESFRDFQERLAQGVEPAVQGTLVALTDLFDLINKIPEPVGKAALGVGATATAIIALKAAAAAAIPVVKTLFALVVANPFVALAAGITAATVALAGYRNESERIADAAVGGDAAAVQAARARLLETEQEISLKKLELEGARGRKAQQIRRELKRLRDDAEALRKSIPKAADSAAAENKITPTGGLPKADEKKEKKRGKTDLERQQEAADKLLKTLEERQTLATALTSDEQKMLQLKIDQANVDEQFPLLSADTRDNIKEQLEALYAQENVTQALKDAADDRAKKEQEVADKQAEQAKKLEDLYKNVGTAIENSIVDGIMGAIDGTQTLQETVSGLLKDIGKMFLQFAVRGLLQSTGLPMFAAEGGYVSGPTNTVVGEGGESEYIIPESKMRESMARYSRGARGSSVIPETGGSGTSGEGGGTAVAAPIDVRYTVERINSVDYVTADQFQAGMQQAANQGAKQGEQQTLKRLQMSSGTRKRLGL
jgi:hypothetical protein